MVQCRLLTASIMRWHYTGLIFHVNFIFTKKVVMVMVWENQQIQNPGGVMLVLNGLKIMALKQNDEVL
jgi:hypothetical protein